MGLRTTGRLSHRDPVVLLTGYVVVLFLIPARLIVGPLGAAGTPGVLVALVAACWWLVSRLAGDVGLSSDGQPLHRMLAVYLWFCLLSVSLSQLRSTTVAEFNGSLRGLIALFAASGMALLIADGIADRGRLDTLLRRLVGVAAAMAMVGIVQFVTGWDPTQFVSIPGLVAEVEVNGVGSRAAFNRPYGTALHPIEFGVVCASLVPLALHYALYGARARRFAWVAATLLISAAPVSVSRSGILCLLIGVGTLSLAWSWRRRRYAAVAGLGFAVVLWVSIPGLLGTLTSMFANAGADPSVTTRQERLPRIFALWRESPWVGQGFGTYNLEDYFLLDNEIFRTLIQVGVIGLCLTLLTIGTGLWMARSARRVAIDEETRHLGQAILASILALASSMATFDAFYYRILYGTLFLLLGAAAALREVLRRDWRTSKPILRALDTDLRR